MPNPLTVLILAAGYGRRMGPFSRMVNKGLVPYNNKPLISHIIEKFDNDTKFVIACGHMGQQLKDYLGTVHNDKHLIFVDIDNYAEGSTGPATTIRMCAEHLRGGFMWLACDTVFDFDYKTKLDHNWIGVRPVDSSIAQDYCWIDREGDVITKIVNKRPSKTAVDAFIGLMYAKDDTYLENLIKRSAKETYEGFEDLDLRAHTVREWKDFGTYEKWEELSKEFADQSFPKPDELFYWDNGKIIKFWTDAEQARMRVTRANLNTVAMPNHVQSVGNFLVHDYAPGDIIYNQLSPGMFRRMLDWCSIMLWLPAEETGHEPQVCHKFYYKKTMERVEKFRVKYREWSEPRQVNGQEVKSIDAYLSDINFHDLSADYEWKFIHGDLHFDNTVYDPSSDKFTAIDWRTDFAGELYGDLYYDLAKMLGGIWLNYREIKNERYGYREKDDCVEITVPSVPDAMVYETILQDWVMANNLNWQKVKQLVPIIYLNMAPLHEAPFDKFLIALAQLHFSRVN